MRDESTLPARERAPDPRGPRVQYCPVCQGDGKRVVDRKPVRCGYCQGCGVIPASAWLYERLWRRRA